MYCVTGEKILNAMRWQTVGYMGTGRRQIMPQNKLRHFCRSLSFISCNWQAVIVIFENNSPYKVKQKQHVLNPPINKEIGDRTICQKTDHTLHFCRQTIQPRKPMAQGSKKRCRKGRTGCRKQEGSLEHASGISCRRKIRGVE